MPSQHAEIGGSIIARVIACPASVKLSRGVPRTSSDAADRGSMLHEAIVQMHTQGLPASALVGFEGFGQVVTPWDAKYALAPAYKALMAFIGTAKPVKLEQRVHFKNMPAVWGTADVLARDGDHGLVADFKFGSHIVDVTDNPQMLFYAAAALSCGGLPARTKHVTLAVIQPEAPRTLTQHTVPVSRLRQFHAQVEQAVKKANSAEPERIPGSHCLWCPARQKCKGALESLLPPSISAAISARLKRSESETKAKA